MHPRSTPGLVERAEIAYDGKSLAIEFCRVCPENAGPLIVFLHQGLGSLHLWRDFPQRLCAATGARGLVYSRTGYGNSTALWPDGNWPTNFMHLEATEILPRFLIAVGADQESTPPILFGHSDGGTIALIYAAAFPQKLSALIVAAPHIFVEAITVEGLAATQQEYQTTDFAERLKKYHRDAAYVFNGWITVWLSEAMRAWSIVEQLKRITCPTLAVQGYQDHYGTMQQIEGIKQQAPQTKLLKLKNCGHSPHFDQPEALLAAVRACFVDLARNMAQGAFGNR